MSFNITFGNPCTLLGYFCSCLVFNMTSTSKGTYIPPLNGHNNRNQQEPPKSDDSGWQVIGPRRNNQGNQRGRDRGRGGGRGGGQGRQQGASWRPQQSRSQGDWYWRNPLPKYVGVSSPLSYGHPDVIIAQTVLLKEILRTRNKAVEEAIGMGEISLLYLSMLEVPHRQPVDILTCL
jgi:hypothetical protein